MDSLVEGPAGGHAPPLADIAVPGAAMRDPAPRFTIVVPVLDEGPCVERLAREIAEACAPLAPFEAIFVDDGSTDATPARIAALRAEFPWLREVRHARSCGQSAALRSGVLAARAVLICTLDGDGQNPPDEMPRLLAPFLAAADALPGLVAGQRLHRRDGRRAGWRRASPTGCAPACSATLRATPAAGSRRSGARCSSRCPTSTICTATCRRWSGARGWTCC